MSENIERDPGQQDPVSQLRADFIEVVQKREQLGQAAIESSGLPAYLFLDLKASPEGPVQSRIVFDRPVTIWIPGKGQFESCLYHRIDYGPHGQESHTYGLTLGPVEFEALSQ